MRKKPSTTPERISHAEGSQEERRRNRKKHSRKAKENG